MIYMYQMKRLNVPVIQRQIAKKISSKAFEQVMSERRAIRAREIAEIREKIRSLSTSQALVKTNLEKFKSDRARNENAASAASTASVEVNKAEKKSSSKKASFNNNLEQKIMASIKTYLTIFSDLFNTVTGYNEINKVQSQIEASEKTVQELQAQVKEDKKRYGLAVSRRSQIQKQINELLTRKHAWSSEDLESFTRLYREDHEGDNLVTSAEQKLDKDEEQLENARSSLVKQLSLRYHHENQWNGKMKAFGTWVTMGLMILNVTVLLLGQLVFEPLRVQRLVDRCLVKQGESHRDIENQLEDFKRRLDVVSQMKIQLSTVQSSLDNVVDKQTDLSMVVSDKQHHYFVASCVWAGILGVALLAEMWR